MPARRLHFADIAIDGDANDDEYSLRRAYRLLMRLREVAPNTVGIQEALDALRVKHPTLEDRVPEARPEELASQLSALPTSSDELHRMLNENLAELVEPLLEYEAKASGFEAPRWYRVGELLSEVVQQHPDDGFTLLDSIGPDLCRANGAMTGAC